MALTQVNGGMLDSVAQQVGFRNRIINGAMMIDQRNAGASVTPTDGQYTLDRWRAGLSQASKFSVQQSSTAPAGFKNSMLVTSLSSYSVGSGDIFIMSQRIEGFNVADMAWGTANAATITISFWVRSSLTGTFGGTFTNSAGSRTNAFSYTINAANTWEQKTVTIAGDTTGTWATDNSAGAQINFSLGVGATYQGTAGTWSSSNNFNSTAGTTYVVGTSGATWYITGVQLEKGSTATSFDYRPYGTELALCQRYYYKSPQTAPGDMWQVYQTNAGLICSSSFPVTMRGTPSLTFGYTVPYSGNTFYRIITGAVTTWTLTDARANANRVYYVYDNSQSGLTLGDGYATYFTASIEL